MSKRAAETAEEQSATKKRKTEGAPETIGQVFTTELHPDWPRADEEIDLVLHDLPHRSSDTEWWYVNSHVETSQGRQFSVFASFFRIVKKATRPDNIEYAHTLSWAVVDVESKKYYYDGFMDHDSAKVMRKTLERPASELRMDPRMRRALIEITERGNVPLPDRLQPRESKVATDKLNLNYSGQTFVKDKDGNYKVHCKAGHFGFTLTFKALKKPIRHGHGGVVKIGLKQDSMFYYFIPRMDVSGSVTVEHKSHRVKGQGWYDHEFGGTIKWDGGATPVDVSASAADMDTKEDGKAGASEGKAVKPATDAYAWNWLAIQLEDGRDISATTLVAQKTGEVYDNFAVVINEDSSRDEFTKCTLVGSDEWVSSRTTVAYPRRWHLSIPEIKAELDINVAFDDQELITMIAKPAFWEGRADVTGSIGGKKVSGLCFIEKHGFHDHSSLDMFFKDVSKLTRIEIERVLPLKPDEKAAKLLIADDGFEHYLDGANIDVFSDQIIKPLREIVDRGGKSWRSFALLLCIDCVGGDSRNYKQWLAMPEIMHVGSLIIDDIQDKSETRRGALSCHKKYGDAIAINAGTAAYFMSMRILEKLTPDLTPAMRLRMYELYFLTLRAGHTGQAFDIHGLDYMMEEVVANGDAKALLVERVRCTHRLKSAVPAGNLARMGAIIGHGSDEQIDSLGLYFESIGVAFQIIDDVLNLRGFEGNTKTRGEDITAGKITYPVARAMGKLGAADRKRLWDIIKSKPEDRKTVEEAVQMIERCGALDDSVKDSTDMVEEAWAKVNDFIPDSFYKMLLRSFGLYVLDRHY